MDEHRPGVFARAFGEEPDARRPPLPEPPEIGPFDRRFWKSPLRGRWLTSITGSALLALIVIAAVTGFLSHVAYETDLGDNAVVLQDSFLAPLYRALGWPAGWPWLYAVTQGAHVIAGVAAIPLLMLKLWSVIPKLWERPAVRSMAHGLERASLGLLVGASLFVFATGVINIQNWYPFGFPFVPGHYLGAGIFLAALGFHLALKLPIVRRVFREEGVLAPLELSRAATAADDPATSQSVATEPSKPTLSRRGLLTLAGGTSLGLAVMMAGQTIGGPFRKIALLAPRGQSLGTGPNDFQINKTASFAGIEPSMTGNDWRLELRGETDVELSRDDLLAMEQATHRLPIACVEGWSTTQEWTGVSIAALAALVGSDAAGQVHVESLQRAGSFNQTTLSRAQLSDERSLLALQVNGVDLSSDHGFPARVIVPALPGVHNTKWVRRMTFGAEGAPVAS